MIQIIMISTVGIQSNVSKYTYCTVHMYMKYILYPTKKVQVERRE